MSTNKKKPRTMKSPLAIARDKFLESEDGKRLCDAAILGAPARNYIYLRNRIELAFLAGAKAATP